MESQFFEAIDKNDIESIKLLLQNPQVDPSARINHAIRCVSSFGYLKMVELLLSDPRVDPSALNNASIRVASENGHLEVVRLLLSDFRVNPRSNNNEAIRASSLNGHLEVVRLLLSDPRADPSEFDSYAIHLASRNGHLEVVRLLLSDSRVDFNSINGEMKGQLLKEEKNKLLKELGFRYQLLKQASPQVTFEGKQKSRIPRPILRKIVYQSKYHDLCLNKSSITLVALADLLKIDYIQKTYDELCNVIEDNI